MARRPVLRRGHRRRRRCGATVAPRQVLVAGARAAGACVEATRSRRRLPGCCLRGRAVLGARVRPRSCYRCWGPACRPRECHTAWLLATPDAVAGERAASCNDVRSPTFRVLYTTCWSCTRHVGSSRMTPTRTPAPHSAQHAQRHVPAPARPALKVARCGGLPLIRRGAGDATPTLRAAQGHRLCAVCSSAHTAIAAPARTSEHAYVVDGQ
jgi:hypothetical protein